MHSAFILGSYSSSLLNGQAIQLYPSFIGTFISTEQHKGNTLFTMQSIKIRVAQATREKHKRTTQI